MSFYKEKNYDIILLDIYVDDNEDNKNVFLRSKKVT